MRLHYLAACAAVALAAPATAQTGGYFGIEGGVLFPKRQNNNYVATFGQTVQTPAGGTVVVAPGVGVVGTLPTTLTTLPGTITGGSRTKFKRGYDVDAIAGYDFGPFRLEGEVGYKRSKIKSFNQDAAFISAVNAGLNPTGATGTAFVLPTGLAAFNLNNRVSVLSGMVNALLDIGGSNGVPSFYAGGGVGRARVKMFSDRDSAWAYQGIAGVRFPLSDNVDIGVKYRYFRTARLDFNPGAATFTAARTAAVANVAAAGGPAPVGTTNVAFTRSANITGDFNPRFSSHSLLLTLSFNFGRAVEALPPAPPPPAAEVPAPPPPPPTQTCPDGSVVLATDACPVPPPPPPPPAQTPERG